MAITGAAGAITDVKVGGEAVLVAGRVPRCVRGGRARSAVMCPIEKRAM